MNLDTFMKTSVNNESTSVFSSPINMVKIFGSQPTIDLVDSKEENEKKTNVEKFITLENVLQSERGISLFMSHCMKELSMENLLSVLEFTQYQIWIISKVDVSNDVSLDCELKESEEKNVDILGNMFPDMIRMDFRKIPKSSIIYGTNRGTRQDRKLKIGNHEFKYEMIMDRIRKLYAKYIENESEFELNIRYELRNKIKYSLEHFNNVDKEAIIIGDIDFDEMYHIFDDLIESIMNLMNDSYRRFLKTKGFEEYKQYLSSTK